MTDRKPQNHSAQIANHVSINLPISHNPALHGEGTICKRCRRVDPTPWSNPLLVTLKKMGVWNGVTMGGVILCDDCEPLYQAERRAQMATGDETFRLMQIPNEFTGATWANYEVRKGNQAATTIAREWLQRRDGRDLYISGGVGSGKSRMAATIAFEAMRDGPAVAFIHAADLFDRLRQAEFKPLGEEDPFRLERLARSRLMVIDDLGVEKSTEFTITRLLMLLEKRHWRSNPTIITSNLDLDELAKKFGDDRIPSRLVDWADLATIHATDYRHERAARRLEAGRGKKR